MASRARALAWVLALGFVSFGTVLGDEAGARAIADAVARLGHPRWRERERASHELWHRGLEAEAALRAAMSSADREVAIRAAHLVELIEWCITPDMRPESWAAIERVRTTTDPEERAALTNELLEHGRSVYPAILGLLRREQDPATRAGIASAITGGDRALLRDAVANAPPVAVTRLLDELAGTGEERAMCDHVAYHTIRGTLAAELARLAGDSSPTGRRRRCCLARALGDHAGAAEIARTLEDDELRLHTLVEGRAFGAALELELARRDPARSTSHAVTAGLAALVGRSEPRAAAVATRALSALMDEVGLAIEDNHACEKLVALGEIDRVLEAIAKQRVNDWSAVREEILDERNDYEQMLAAQDRHLARPDERWAAQLERVRIFAVLGRADATEAEIAAALRGTASDVRGQREAAVFQRLGNMRLPGAARRQFLVARKDDAVGEWAEWLRYLWPLRTEEVDAWWAALVARRPDAGGARLFEELFTLLEGHSDPDAVVEGARAAASTVGSEAVAALAETCRRVGRAEAGMELLAAGLPAAEAGTSMRLARFAIRAGLWARAEEASRATFEACSHAAEPMLVRIEALERLGRRDLATALIDRAHLLALASTEERLELAAVLERIGRVAEARRVLDVALRTTSDADAGERVALAAWRLAPDDDAAALDAWIVRAEVARLGRLADEGSIAIAYAMDQARELAIAHGIRARLDGRPRDALAHARAALAIDPNEFEANALHQAVAEPAEAARVREAAFRFHESQRARDPASAHLQNQFAWFAARVRARLDEALVAAERAVELEPSSQYYLDTLAEVRFQKGDRAGALAASERALSIVPADGYYHRQRRRFAEGDPRSEPK